MWVLWNVEQSKVTLTKNLHPWCFTQLEFPKPKAKPPVFQIVLDRDNQRRAFKMEANRIKEEDADLGIPVESSELSFGKEGKREKVAWIPFLPYIYK